MAGAAKGLVDVIVVAKKTGFTGGRWSSSTSSLRVDNRHGQALQRQSGETDLSDSNAVMILRIRDGRSDEVDRIRSESLARSVHSLNPAGYGGGRRPSAAGWSRRSSS